MASTMRRPLARLAAVALTALAAVAATISPAHADLVYDDGFEGNPSERWSWSTTYDGNVGFDLQRGLARTGANNGWLMAETGTASLNRYLDFPWWAGQCAGGVYIRPSAGDTVLTLDVWALDPDDSGGYQWRLRNSSAHTLNAGDYQYIEFGTTQTAYGGTATLHYWITLNGGGAGNHKLARVDDLFVRCW
ncbi:MAG TPA: hypothetical protein VGE61_05845 [Glycomyces sp.]